jgi:acetylornithine deacetylase/succinyl-diaminopimelate desuccinylase-like protein
MKITALRCVSLCLGAGTLALALALALSLDAAESGAAGNTGTAAAAPDPVRAQAREIFAHIVGIESSIGKGKVPLVAKYLADRFKAGGFADADIHILPLGETASLVVRYRGKGGGAKPIAFMAHMDVVTAKRSDWQRDPYTLTEENGFFYGRGTSDVKQEVALLTATFLRLKAEGFVPTRDLIIAFSGDEETAQATARDLVTAHRDLVARRGLGQTADFLRPRRGEEFRGVLGDHAQSGRPQFAAPFRQRHL